MKHITILIADVMDVRMIEELSATATLKYLLRQNVLLGREVGKPTKWSEQPS
jgi:hypothetical protein